MESASAAVAPENSVATATEHSGSMGLMLATGAKLTASETPASCLLANTSIVVGFITEPVSGAVTATSGATFSKVITNSIAVPASPFSSGVILTRQVPTARGITMALDVADIIGFPNCENPPRNLFSCETLQTLGVKSK